MRFGSTLYIQIVGYQMDAHSALLVADLLLFLL